MVMTRSDRGNRRTQDGFVMDCPLCGAYLRWAHLEASSHGSICTFCGTTVVPTRPDGFRDLDERLIEVEDLGLITYQPQRLVFHAKHDLQVWLGHGSGVTLTVDGKNVSLGSNSTKLKVTLRNGHVSITQI